SFRPDRRRLCSSAWFPRGFFLPSTYFDLLHTQNYQISPSTCMICAIFQPELYLLNVKEHSMRRITLVILSLVCVVILYGCSKTETNNNNSMASNTARPATNPAGEKP